MSKPKFKVGDSVVVIDSIMKHPNKIKNIGKIFKVEKVSNLTVKFKYTLDDNRLGLGYSEKELELVKATECRTYTGIELLQAIKDGEFKAGDEFEVVSNKGKSYGVMAVYKGYFSDYTLRWDNGVNVTTDHILSSTLKPIKREPINLAPENKTVASSIHTNKIGVVATFKGNTVTVELADGSKGIAKCSPEDKFDKDTGIKLAFNRAMIDSFEKAIESIINSTKA